MSRKWILLRKSERPLWNITKYDFVLLLFLHWKKLVLGSCLGLSQFMVHPHTCYLCYDLCVGLILLIFVFFSRRWNIWSNLLLDPDHFQRGKHKKLSWLINCFSINYSCLIHNIHFIILFCSKELHLEKVVWNLKHQLQIYFVQSLEQWQWKEIQFCHYRYLWKNWIYYVMIIIIFNLK